MTSTGTETSRSVRTPTVLLIEDNEADARLLEMRLTSVARDTPSPIRAVTLAEGIRLAVERGSEIDLILLDLGLPDGFGVGNVKELLAVVSEIPVVVLTGLSDEDVAIEAVHLGAQDYLVKGEFDGRSLMQSIRFALERHEMQREIETVLRRENEVKDRFLSHVSHELRTPLTAVMQFASILSDGIAGDLNDQQLEYVGVIHRNADQLKQMINTLMDVTRAASDKLTCQPERVSVARVVADAVDALSAQAEEKRVRLDVSLCELLPEVIADPCRVTQVITNLLGNALRFTEPGGEIVVSVELDSENRDHVRFSVRDTGCGMADEALERVFDRLFQGSPQAEVSRNGLGLGLFICREILELHGGRIWAESRVGEGSCFYFTVPSYSLEAAVRKVAAPAGELQLEIALLAACVTADDVAARAQGAGSVLPEMEEVVRSCVLGATDAVLPMRRNGGDREWVFAVARADQEGARAIERRIRGEIDRRGLRDRGFRSDVSSHRFVVPAEDGEAWAVADTTRRVEAQLRMLSTNGDAHERDRK